MLFSIVLGITAFQCSSTEITSAKLYIQQNNYDKAVEVLKKEVEKNPQSDEGYYLLGYVLGEQGNIEGMLENFEKSKAISEIFVPNIKESRRYHWADNFNKGVQLFNRGAQYGGTDSAKATFEKAIVRFENAIACEPDSVDTYKNLAYAYINMGDRDGAVEPLQKLIELKNDEDSYVQLGDLYIQKGLTLRESGEKEKAMEQFEKSIKVLEEGRKNYPENGDILLLLSNSYIAADKLDIAKEAFKAGVEREPENKYYRYNYGSLLLNAEEYEAAAVQLEKALELDPEYENAIYNLAVTNVKWGAEIREELEAKEIESDEYKGKFEAALPLLEKYLSINEEEGSVWDLLGKVYANLGMPEKSKEAFEKADLYR
jgi:FimV-like protein